MNPDGNDRLTAALGVLVLAPVLVEIATVLLGVHTFMSWHVFVGLALIPAARASVSRSRTSCVPMPNPWYGSATSNAISPSQRSFALRTIRAIPAGRSSPST